MRKSASVLYMSMSLDGFIAGPNDDPGNPGGDGFGRLHDWLSGADGQLRPPGPAGELYDEMNATGAVRGQSGRLRLSRARPSGPFTGPDGLSGAATGEPFVGRAMVRKRSYSPPTHPLQGCNKALSER
jgi:hypothetical protein